MNQRSESISPTNWLTLAITLNTSILAFDSLAVATVAPQITEQLGSRGLYGWIFSIFFLASILGTILSGQLSDNNGPRRPISWGFAIFTLGLLSSGVAGSMPVFLIGRALQGFGSGLIMTALHVVVNLSYPDSERSGVFKWMAAGWTIPALLGPVIATYITALVSWRLIYTGLIPLTCLVAAIIVPKVTLVEHSTKQKSQVSAALSVVVGAALLLTSPSLDVLWQSLLLAAGGLGLGYKGLKSLLIPGTFSFRRGLPIAIIVHGLVFSAFSVVEAYLALAISETFEFPTWSVGVIIGVSSFAWVSGSWLQDALDKRDTSSQQRQRRALLGIVALIAGLSIQVAAFSTSIFPILSLLVGGIVAGVGVGLSHTASLMLVHKFTPKGDEGKASAAMMLYEQLAFSLCVGAAGTFLSLTSAQIPKSDRILTIFLFAIGIAIFALLVSPRLTKPTFKVFAGE